MVWHTNFDFRLLIMEIIISVRVKYQAQKSEMYTGMYGYAC